MCFDPVWWNFRLIFLSEFYWKAQAVYMQGSNVRDRCCFFMKVLCLVAQSCLTLWDPIDFSLPGSSVHGDSPGKNTGVGGHALFQGIFPTRDQTQVSHISGRPYRLSHQGTFYTGFQNSRGKSSLFSFFAGK